MLRQRITSLSSELNDESHTFRMIQKRLLVRFKDRNPTSLGGLDIVMKKSYERILELSKWTTMECIILVVLMMSYIVLSDFRLRIYFLLIT